MGGLTLFNTKLRVGCVEMRGGVFNCSGVSVLFCVVCFQTD